MLRRPSPGPKHDEIVGLIEAVHRASPNDLALRLDLCSQLDGILADGKLDNEDDFRDAGGFLVVIHLLSALDSTEVWVREKRRSQRLGAEEDSAATSAIPGTTKGAEPTQLAAQHADEPIQGLSGSSKLEGAPSIASQDAESLEAQRVALFRYTFSILAKALSRLPNRRAFHDIIGWSSLRDTIRLSTMLSTSAPDVLSILIAFSVGVTDHPLFLAELLSELKGPEISNLGAQEKMNFIDDRIRTLSLVTKTVKHPKMLCIVLDLLEDVAQEDSDKQLQVATVTAIGQLTEVSRRNQVVINRAGMIALLLPTLRLDITPPASPEEARLDALRWKIVRRLLEVDTPTADARFIMSRMVRRKGSPGGDVLSLNERLLDLALATAVHCGRPRDFYFDQSLHGCASIEFESLPRPFPPTTVSKGYTFITTFRIEQIDPDTPAKLDILHIHDPLQECSTKLVLDSHSGILSYVSSPTSPVLKFGRFVFEPARQYHLALVHQRPKSGKLSSVQLFVDGAPIEMQVAVWPSPPKMGSPVQATLGTSPSFPRFSRLVWAIGPTHLIDDALPDELIFILAQVGPRYNGTMQDALGHFLAYRASTAVDMRLDSLAKELQGNEKELAHRPLMVATWDRAGALVPRERIYFSLNAGNVRKLKDGSMMAINSAMATFEEAFSVPHGQARLHGESFMIASEGFDEAVWKLGGIAVALRVVEAANEPKLLTKAVALFVELLQHSWRLWEDVERSRGCEIFAYLLRHKAHLMSVPTQDILLSAIGYEATAPEQSLLVYPSLYRCIFLDFNFWTRAPIDVRVYLDHFVTLMRTSRHRRYNVRRMARMSVVKSMLYALKANLFRQDLIENVISTLRVILISSFSDTAIRNVTAFLASQLCQSGQVATPKPLKRSQTLDPRRGPTTSGADGEATPKGAREPALLVLEMLTELICDRPAYLTKFSSSTNIKWLLLFFHPKTEPRAASLALRILSCLLAQGGRFVQNFNAIGGFKVLERLLPPFWTAPTVLHTSFSILFGVRISTIRDGLMLTQAFAPTAQEMPVACPAMMRAITACIKEALRTLDNHNVSEAKRKAYKGRPSDHLAEPLSSKRRHQRKRSQSISMDAKSLADFITKSNEQVLLDDIIRVIEAHVAASYAFRDFIFTPAVLRGFIDAIIGFVAPTDTSVNMDVPVAIATSIRIVELLARLATDSILTSGSIAIVQALHEGIPPADLTQQMAFQAILFRKIISVFQDTLDKSPELYRNAKTTAAFAKFTEACVEEISSGLELEGYLFQLLVSFLKEERKCSDSTSRSLLASLHRVLLHRIAEDGEDERQIFEQVSNFQTMIFRVDGADPLFYPCLINRILASMSGTDETTARRAFKLLQLLALGRPTIVAPILVAGRAVPDLLQAGVGTSLQLIKTQADGRSMYAEEWQSFLKIRETVKASAHLERIRRLKALLDRNDSRDASTLATQRKMQAWHRGITEEDAMRFKKFRLDYVELDVFAKTEWDKLVGELQRERALFGPEEDSDRTWRIDSTEGPNRMRKKLQEVSTPTDDNRYLKKSSSASPLVPGPVSEGIDTALQAETEAPDADTAEATQEAVEDSNGQASEQLEEDKFRRVLRSLQQGDVIEDVVNTSRVIGIESRGCLLILGRHCIYLLDDYFRASDGELVNVWEAPSHERDALVLATVFSEPSELVKLDGKPQSRRWQWSALTTIYRRTWLFRRTGIELFFEDGQSCLLILDKPETAEDVFRRLKVKAPATATSSMDSLRDLTTSTSSGPSSLLPSRIAGAVLGRNQQVGALMTQKWIKRDISNYAYLMSLNTLAGRSFNDLTQFPVFPWVVADYESSTLDFDKPETFRDMSLPMGAQTPGRRKDFEERYTQLSEVEEVAFHYGTHYSSSAAVCGYLIRLRPYERQFLALQGGSFDLADRLFSSIRLTWDSASRLSRGDVRELVPEFYSLPEFLSNPNGWDFGRKQDSAVVDDVELPKWARRNPRLFIQLHREALESDYVSAHLHEWIDLIWGYKQTGDEARAATNVFHPLSYEGSIDLDSIEDPDERAATIGVVHNFGQTPRQLFTRPHPLRNMTGVTSLPVGERLGVEENCILIQGIAPFRKLKGPVRRIYLGSAAEKVVARMQDCIALPSFSMSISFNHPDNSLRLLDDAKFASAAAADDARPPLSVNEEMSSGQVTCCAMVNTTTLLAGSEDGNLTAWKLNAAEKEFTFVAVMRGHKNAIACVTASTPWSIAVTGSKDRTAIIWDTNRAAYVRSLRGHQGAVHLVAVNDETGDVATASLAEVRLWSINGDALATVSTSPNLSEPIASMAFYEREYHRGGTIAIVLTGHRGKIIGWKCGPEEKRRAKGVEGGKKEGGEAGLEVVASHEVVEAAKWTFMPFHVFEHSERLGEGHEAPLITAISASRTALWTGDEYGRVFAWTLPGEAVPLPDQYSTSCMNHECGHRFGVLEARRLCGGCGGLFCSACAMNIAGLTSRFCPFCRALVGSLEKNG